MKKRLVLGFSAFALSFALAACGSGSSKSESAAGAPAAEDWAVTENQSLPIVFSDQSCDSKKISDTLHSGAEN